MFDDFTLEMVDTGETTLRVRHGGRGPSVLLLHGHPQTHVMWHQITPRLADEFTVVCADLRGYGDSSRPRTTPDHEAYSKRAMARAIARADAPARLRAIFSGGPRPRGRVAYRLALDHSGWVSELAVLDIIPTAEV